MENITDGRKWRGEYESDLIAWFAHQHVDTRCVLVDSIRQRKVTNRVGKVMGYRVRWREARLDKEGNYERDVSGYLKTRVRAKRSKTPALR